MSSLNCAINISSKNSKSHFLRLPPEISDEIYSLLLPPRTIHFIVLSYDDFSETTDAEGQTSIPPLHPPRTTLWTRAKYLDRMGLDLSILFVCRQIYIQASRLFYSRNAFDYSAVALPSGCVLNLAISKLRALCPASFHGMKTLYIDHLTPHRLNFGITVDPGYVDGDGENHMQVFEGDTDIAQRFQQRLEALCGMLKVVNLSLLGLGFELPEIRGWNGRMEDVSWITPLLEMLGPGGVKARIVVWRHDGQDVGSIGGRSLVDEARRIESDFLRKLVRMMRERRLLHAGGLDETAPIDHDEAFPLDVCPVIC